MPAPRSLTASGPDETPPSQAGRLYLLVKSGLLLAFFLWNSCQQTGSETTRRPPASGPESLAQIYSPVRYDPSLARDGKSRRPKVIPSIYQAADLQSLDFPIISSAVLNGLDLQLQLLEQVRPLRNYRIGELQFSVDQLLQAAQILKSRQHTRPVDLHLVLEAHQLWGNDRRGNVLFTGYFTPVIPVRKQPDEEFPYPIYKRPRDWEGPLPSRMQIEQDGALAKRDLEIAYARSKVDIYYMQLQGSGYVAFPDGSRKLFSYDGTNRHPYRSIEKYLLSRPEWEISDVSIAGVKRFFGKRPELTDSVLFQNPSYTFFQPRKAQPSGAGNVPLQDGFSVAVDQRYIPLGSCLLAAVPIYDKKQRRVVGHEFRLVLAQDVGGRIKGPGHIDLYFGVGPEARAQAGRMRHYGRLWLLLPKAKALPISMRSPEQNERPPQ